MLGETGTEQFIVETFVNGRKIGSQSIHDPFITTKIELKMSRWDALKAAIFGDPGTTVSVHVDGTSAAIRAVMSLDPEALAAEEKCEIEYLSKNIKFYGEQPFKSVTR